MVVLEAGDAAGGQIRLASSSPRRRDLIGIIDWRLAECKHFDVDVRYNTYAEADDVLAEDPDVVVVATGGIPNTEFLNSTVASARALHGRVCRPASQASATVENSTTR